MTAGDTKPGKENTNVVSRALSTFSNDQLREILTAGFSGKGHPLFKGVYIEITRWWINICHWRRCPHRAEDVAQQAWLKVTAHVGRHGIDDIDNMRAWLMTVVVCTISSDKRATIKDKFTQSLDSLEILDTIVVPGTPEESAQATEQIKIVLNIIADLPDKERQIALRIFWGESQTDAAKAVGAIASKGNRTWKDVEEKYNDRIDPSSRHRPR